ncbi:pollen allergen Phl p 5b-like [Triticum aestivum]|nr:pollen allergen Phl p 5b-like [Triticum aestivum]
MPAEGGTPTDAAASTPAEAATPTDSAASTPAEGGTPDKAAAGYSDTTPAEQPAADGTKTAPGEGKATTVEQKFIEKMNQAYKKAVEAANVAEQEDKFSVFDATFNKEIKQCLAGMSAKFMAMIDRAFKIAYNSAAGAATAKEKFAMLFLTLTEALRFISATLDAHAIKPAMEEVVAGGVKAASGATQVIKKLDTVIKAASAAAKEAPKADRILVFQAALNKFMKEQMGPAYDQQMMSDLDAEVKKAAASSSASKTETKDTDVADALAKTITTIANATKDGAETAAAPVAEAGTKTAAAESGYKAADKSAAAPAAESDYKAAHKSAAEPAAAPAAEAATAPAADAASKPAAAESGYKAKAEAAPEPAAESATKSAAKPAADAAAEPAAEAATKPADGKAGYKDSADAATKPAAAGGYNL